MFRDNVDNQIEILKQKLQLKAKRLTMYNKLPSIDITNILKKIQRHFTEILVNITLKLTIHQHMIQKKTLGKHLQ